MNPTVQTGLLILLAVFPFAIALLLKHWRMEDLEHDLEIERNHNGYLQYQLDQEQAETAALRQLLDQLNAEMQDDRNLEATGFKP